MVEWEGAGVDGGGGGRRLKRSGMRVGRSLVLTWVTEELEQTRRGRRPGGKPRSGSCAAVRIRQTGHCMNFHSYVYY